MSTSSESEWTTRKKRINPQFEASGWQVEAFVSPSHAGTCAHHALIEFPTANGSADYALLTAAQPMQLSLTNGVASSSSQ
jgi:type I restriction enzyme, R subunit